MALDADTTPFAQKNGPAEVTDQRRESVGAPKYTLSYPEVTGADGFNGDVSNLVAELKKKRLPDMSAGASTNAGGDGAADGKYSLNWAATQNSSNHLSVLFHERNTLPGAHGEAFYSKVLDRTSGQSMPVAQMFTDDGKKKLSAAVLAALDDEGAKTSVEDAEDLSSAQRDAIVNATIADGRGGLAVHLGGGILTARSDKPLVVDVPGEKAAAWLTEAGRKWLSDTETGPTLQAGQKMPENLRRERPAVNCAEVKCVALTFDDGPGDTTPQLLDTLDEENVPATFFVLGRSIHGHEDTLRRAAAAGHEIGSHTWTHPQLTRLPKAKAEKEHARVNATIRDVTGQAPTMFRPPYGAFRKGVPSGGLPSIIWSVDSNDWRNKSNPAATVKNATTGIHPGDVILMHDIHKASVDAAPQIIKKLKEQGFTLVTVSDLFGKKLEAGKSYYSDERMQGSRHIAPWAG